MDMGTSREMTAHAIEARIKQLGIDDVENWLREHGEDSPVRSYGGSGLKAIGERWDGSPPIKSDDGASDFIGRALRGLGDAIGQLGIVGVAAPGERDVRFCEDASYGHRQIVVDVDMGGFILPLATRWRYWRTLT